MFSSVVLEKTLESPLDSKEIKPVHPKWNQSWIFIGRTNAEAGTPILWPPDVKNWFIRRTVAEAKAPVLGPLDAKSWLTGKDPDAGKDWGQEEKGAVEDEMVGWHLWHNGHESELTPRDSEGQGSLACCSPWGCRVRHDLATEQQQKITCQLVARARIKLIYLWYFW